MVIAAEGPSLRKRYGRLDRAAIDAHTEPSGQPYLGTPHNHACVGRRMSNAGARLVQVGIRSMSEEEDRFLKSRRR